MEQNNFLKVFAIFAFVVLMGVSCWATVESLHLLLPSWPVLLFWAVTVTFFVLASIGSKRIVDSLNAALHLDGKGWRLLGGIILLVWRLFNVNIRFLLFCPKIVSIYHPFH